MPRSLEARARDQTPQAGWHDRGTLRAPSGSYPGLLGPGLRLPIRGPAAGDYGQRVPRGVQLWPQRSGRQRDASVLAAALLRYDQLCFLQGDGPLGGGEAGQGGGVDRVRRTSGGVAPVLCSTGPALYRCTAVPAPHRR